MSWSSSLAIELSALINKYGAEQVAAVTNFITGPHPDVTAYDAFEDALADVFSASQSHSEVYYTVEQIVRRAEGPLADLIRKASDGIENGWATQLPKEVKS